MNDVLETVSESDMPAIERMITLAFAGTAEGVRRWFSYAGTDNLRVLRTSGGVPAATLLRVPMGQYFGGRSVPMLGIAGVAVAPEDRGKGYARRLMAASVREAHDEGWPLAGLYASTQALYRQVGYEQAASWFRYTIPAMRLESRDRRDPVVPLGDEDMDAVKACYAAFAAAFDGMLARGPYIWRRVRENRETTYHGFGVRAGGGGLDGYLFLSQERLPSGRQRIALSDLAMRTPDAGRRLLSFLGDFSMMAEEVTFCGGPAHPLMALLPQQRFRCELNEYSLTRVVHVKRALEERGYSPAVRGEVHLDVRDAIAPGNQGRWTLRVEGGRGQVTPGGRGDVTLDVRGLAPIYTGFLSATQASLIGWASGPRTALDTLGGLFTGGSPWMTDMY